MGRTKSIIDEDIRQRRQALGQFEVIFFLGRVETGILEHQHVPELKRFRSRFGNRANAFGQLHNAAAGGNDRGHYWWGPSAYRTRGANWIDEYQLWPMGLLAAPRLLAAE